MLQTLESMSTKGKTLVLKLEIKLIPFKKTKINRMAVQWKFAEEETIKNLLSSSSE